MLYSYGNCRHEIEETAILLNVGLGNVLEFLIDLALYLVRWASEFLRTCFIVCMFRFNESISTAVCTRRCTLTMSFQFNSWWAKEWLAYFYCYSFHQVSLYNCLYTENSAKLKLKFNLLSQAQAGSYINR